MRFQAPFTLAVAAMAGAIAAIANWWGDNATLLHLMQSDTNIDANTLVGSFTEANFGGYSATNPNDASEVLIDPTTGRFVLHFPAPGGGYVFKVTSLTNVPQTIYGAYLTDATGVHLLGAAKFTTPIVLTSINQYIDLGELTLPLSATPLG